MKTKANIPPMEKLSVSVGLTIPETALLFNTSTRTIHREASKGRLVKRYYHGKVLICSESIRKYMAEAEA